MIGSCRRAAAVLLAAALACGSRDDGGGGGAPAAAPSGGPAPQGDGGSPDGAPGGGGPSAGGAGCGDAWQGTFQLGPALAGGIAVQGCSVALVGGTEEFAALGARSFGRGDPFLARLDASGRSDQVVQFGTDNPESARSVAFDAAGSRWVAWSSSARIGGGTAYASRFAEDGTETLRYAAPYEAGSATVAVDGAGNAYLVGTRLVKVGAPSDVFAYAGDVFVVKLDGATGAEAWSILLGTAGSDVAWGAAVDADGSLLVAGSTTGDLAGASAGGTDGFVARIGADGKVAQVLQFGGPGADGAEAVAADGAGNVWVLGSGVLERGGTAPPTARFLAKLDRALSPIWSRRVPGIQASALAAGAGGDAWVAGMTTEALPGQASSGRTDAFVARYDGAGNARWVRQLGSAEDDFPRAVAVDGEGNAYLAGQTLAPSSGLPTSFVAKIRGDGSVP